MSANGTAAQVKASHRLEPLVGQSQVSERLCTRETLAQLDWHWDRLANLGFDLELDRDSLSVHNRDAGFQAVIQLSGQDDLGQRRELFQKLNQALGGFWSRLSWLMRPGPSVTIPYESLKAIIAACQSIRSRLGDPPRDLRS